MPPRRKQQAKSNPSGPSRQAASSSDSSGLPPLNFLDRSQWAEKSADELHDSLAIVSGNTSDSGLKVIQDFEQLIREQYGESSAAPSSPGIPPAATRTMKAKELQVMSKGLQATSSVVDAVPSTVKASLTSFDWDTSFGDEPPVPPTIQASVMRSPRSGDKQPPSPLVVNPRPPRSRAASVSS